MKIYLISQSDNNGYDTFDSAVVAAENEEDARNMQPCFGGYEPFEYKRYGTWAKKIENVKVEEIGTANSSIEKGVILASFNAG